jgi:S-adenosylmethionine:tRNA ribosyltransferase-isomerase
MSAPFAFALPPDLAAREPPECRGLSRDGVRLLVLDRATGAVEHTRFNRLGEFLQRGDLLVFNSSRTLPAVLRGRVESASSDVEVRLAEHLSDDTWLALILEGARERDATLRYGQRIQFGDGLSAEILGRDAFIPRLRRLRFSATGSQLIEAIYRLGRPIRYEHVSRPWCLDYYQTVYACEPGSAEMPSAGRAFTWQMLRKLERLGIDSTRIVLHTGLSSFLDDEFDAAHPASEEEYRISPSAAAKVNRARLAGRRVVAVGTTVVRALESAATTQGSVRPGHAYTRLRVTAEHTLRVVDGLLTGLHEPEASHLDLLIAFVPAATIRDAYDEAIRRRYLWHEFGDLNLII